MHTSSAHTRQGWHLPAIPAFMEELARDKGNVEDLQEYERSREGFGFTYRDATYQVARDLGITFRTGRSGKASR